MVNFHETVLFGFARGFRDRRFGRRVKDGWSR
jgi:hypothetical protein